jgi:hypothetical protein
MELSRRQTRIAMTRNSALTWATIVALAATVAALVVLAVVLWPPTVVTGLLLAALFLLPSVALLAGLARLQRRVPIHSLSAEAIIGMSDEEMMRYRLQALADLERQLEIRELRLARQLRTAQLAGTDYIDLLEAAPSEAELDRLVGKDLELVALIEEESRLAFDRVRENRYAAESGVNTVLILTDVRDFVEKVARLYHPESEHILFETEIELVAKSLSSASLHLLLVIDDLPFDLKTYSTAKMYRTIRRAVSYYGTYKSFQPYIEHGMNALQAARLAVGINPLAVGAMWVAGKLTTKGAKVVGERLLQRVALQLLNDFIRVVGFEAAMMYGSGFRHRDANWVLGAELVNLEVSRGGDLAGRDAALGKLCNLVLRNEFDRMHLVTHLSRHKPIDVSRVAPATALTTNERERIASELARHCRATGVDMDDKSIARWRQSVEAALDLELPDEVADEVRTGSGPRKRGWFDRLLRSRRKSTQGESGQPGGDT